MYGIVTIVEGEGAAQIAGLWQDWRDRFGDDALRGFSLPHMTYHVAGDYDLDGVGALLEGLAAEVAPFEVPMNALSVLVAEEVMVTCLAPAHSPPLARLHGALWEPASRLGTKVVDLYAPETWRPHVTLAYEPVILEAASEIANALRERRLPSTLEVDHLAVIEEQP